MGLICKPSKFNGRLFYLVPTTVKKNVYHQKLVNGISTKSEVIEVPVAVGGGGVRLKFEIWNVFCETQMKYADVLERRESISSWKIMLFGYNLYRQIN